MRRVYGVYKTNHEAREAVKELLRNNYSKEEIRVISNRDFFEKDLDENIHEDDRSLWEKIKDAFSFHEYDDSYWEKEILEEEDRILLEPYRENLNARESVIVVDERDTVDKVEEEFPEEVVDIPLGDNKVNNEDPFERNRIENDPIKNEDLGPIR